MLYITSIVPEGFMQDFEFLWKTVGVTDSLGLVTQRGEHSLFVGRVVVRCRILTLHQNHLQSHQQGSIQT
jgi:hypothetical protein